MTLKIAYFLRFIALILTILAIYSHNLNYFIFAWLVYTESNFMAIESKFEAIGKGLGKFSKIAKEFMNE